MMNDQGTGSAMMLLRLALQFAGGIMVSKGLTDGASWAAFSTDLMVGLGAIVSAGGVVWSWIARIRLQRAAAAKGLAAAQVAAPTLAQVDAVLARPAP